MPMLVRSACLSNFREVAASTGIDARAQLRQAGIDWRCLDNPDLKIPAASVCELLERAAAAAGIVLLWPEPVAVPVITRQEPPPVPVVETRAAAIFQANPLEQEKLALQRDARRASRFLIDCLPSLDTALE